MKVSMKTAVGASLALALLVSGPLSAEDDFTFSLELEAGPAWQSKNDVQIPNDLMGTRFSLEDLVGTGPWAAGRVYFTWNINRKHSVRLMAAPLSYPEPGIFDEPVEFAGGKPPPYGKTAQRGTCVMNLRGVSLRRSNILHS